MVENVGMLTQYLERFTYIGLLFILFLCGLGIPLPEEIILMLGGYLIYEGLTHYTQTVFMGIIGVVVGDLTLYTIGSKWGGDIINHHRFSWIFTPKRMEKAQRYLHKYGKRTIFIARFLSGVRGAVHIMAGTLKMPTLDFLMMDFIAAILSVPAFVYIGYFFGGNINKTLIFINKGSHVILALVIAAITGIVYYLFKNRSTSKDRG